MTTQLILDESNFKDILNGMVDGIITINSKGLILSFNKTAETMFGYKSEDIIGQNVSLLMPEPERSAHDSYIHNHLTTGIAHIIGIGRGVTALKKNGETFPMHLSVIEYPVKIEGDRWFIGSCRDITLQKQQEEQLRRSLKMDAIGKLTSGIAHDYNNMLGVIMGYSDLLTAQCNDQPKSLKYIEAIKHATKRATSLTQKLLSITRKRIDTAKVCVINDILRFNQQLLDKTLTPQIKISLKLTEDLWPTFIDKGYLVDAVLNLSINAMHAMPEGGELNITTSNAQINTLDAQILNISAGDYVKFTIEDTGIGMTEEVTSHIFEPFYSTKGEKGTGLGLSQVYNFIAESKGAIRVYSEPGYGSRFTIYLPRYLQEQFTNEVDRSITENEVDLSGSANILVVDDEHSNRELVKNILTSHGYTVFCSENANEALTLLENKKIDLVLSDVIMPETDGFELAHIISCTHPDVKVQLCSGMVNIKGKSITNETLSKNLLEKPYTSKQLLIRVHELLNK
ncbi:MAG: PAS domain S-box protein [Gammaproteobacteria bacterium]|nr:PAS domain S-box protein [Gammaproteobacteria bacterium]